MTTRKSDLETKQISIGKTGEPPKGDAHHLQPGATLAERYLIEGVIGIGGMGAVYRARDLHFPNVVKLVAVKEMVNQAHEPGVRETIVRNFEREANILATLSHPAIPSIYDYFTQGERSYLVLEYVFGKDLEAILNAEASFLPEGQVVGWALEICDVLHYLHAHQPEPIIFRDLKPSNIMVNQHNRVVLVDFGIAKPFQAGTRGTMIGTEGYSPPEQYRGQAGAVADIYSLGATLHHLLTRRDPRLEPPFSYAERPIRSINPAVSIELEAVVQTALQYSPGDRFPSAPAMKEALLGCPSQAGSLTGSRSAGSPARLPNASVNPLWTFACEDEIRGTPACDKGSIYVGSYDNNLYALSAATGKFIWKYPTDGGVVTRPIIAENEVFFGSEDFRLHVVSVHSGKVIWTYYTAGPVRSSPHPAEGHLFFGSDDSFLHAVNMLSGRCAWKTDVGAPVRSTPMVSDEAIYFGTEAGDFFCLDYHGSIKWRFKAKRAVTSSPFIKDRLVYFASMDANLYALEGSTGWAIWRFRMGKGSISTPCETEGLIFTGSIDGNLYCVEARSAKEKWRFSTDHQITGSPIVYKDSLYFGSVDGYFYCLEYRTGRLRWKFRTGGPITGTPAARDDTIYIGSTDHNLYAFTA